MPMLPSPAAAAVYGTVKVIGYSLYATGLSNHFDRIVHPVTFGVIKTLLGLAAGVTLFFSLMAFLPHATDAQSLLIAAPFRLMVWLGALHFLFKFGRNWQALLAASLLGTALAYAMDGVMWLLYGVLPGMQMPWC